MSRDEGFLARWSRRKLAEPTPAIAPVPPPAAVPAVELDPAVKAARDLLGDDLPVALRSQALRSLWRSDPSLAAMDVMDLHNHVYITGLAANVVSGATQCLAEGVGQREVREAAAVAEPVTNPSTRVPLPADEG